MAAVPPGQYASVGSDRVAIRRVIHTIHAVADIAACRAQYLDLFGAVLFAEGYFAAEDRDMALLYAVDYMLEPMAPRDAGNPDKPFARYLARYGQGFHSFEIKVDDGPRAAALFREHGCSLASEYGQFFFVRPESTGGVLLEVCELPMPNDPFDRGHWRPEVLRGHPSGLLGLDHIACLTRDADAALRFFSGLCDGELLADAATSLPQPGRRVALRLGDRRVDFIEPDDVGAAPARDFLAPPTSGIYAHVWRVEDLARAEAFFVGRGLTLTREHCAAPGFAIDPADFLGARHEFIAA